MKSVEVTIFVEPTPKGRAKGTIVDGHVSMYTPKKTTNAESLIIASIRKALPKEAEMVHTFEKDVPLRVEATFYRLRPQHLPRRVLMPVSNPDVDNYGKLLLDALNHYLYWSDSQITTLVLRKRFVAERQVPRIQLRVREDLY